MTITFKVIVAFFFLAHTALVAYILRKLDDDSSLFVDLFTSATWSMYIMMLGAIFLFSAIEEKGVHYGECQYSAPLHPFESSCGDSVYLKTDCNLCLFHIFPDSAMWISNSRCYTIHIEEGETPYYECISIVAEPWVSRILLPENEHLQPRYILKVPRSGECKVPCEETSEWEWWDYPPY